MSVALSCMTVLFISGLTPRNFLSSRGFGFRSVRPPKPWRYEIFGAKIARMREKIALFPRNSPYHLILFKKFSDICIPKGFHKTPYCRNSSAVEHFTRNEGVPSSNLVSLEKSAIYRNVTAGFFVSAQRKGVEKLFVLYCRIHCCTPNLPSRLLTQHTSK